MAWWLLNLGCCQFAVTENKEDAALRPNRWQASVSRQA
jgi:hypothetical protein